MSEDLTVRVNFGKPMPLFPLAVTPLVPQQTLPLRIFEPRYVQMVESALDGAGQIAMATFEGSRWTKEYHGRPPLRRSVCIGQIVQHAKLPDDTYAMLLQGVCRARIAAEIPAAEGGGRLYREAMLEPLGLEHIDEHSLEPFRQTLTDKLSSEPLSTLRSASGFIEHLRDENVNSSAIIDAVGLMYLNDPELRYRLLDTGDARRRAQIIADEISGLEVLLRKAMSQRKAHPPPPKGVSVN